MPTDDEIIHRMRRRISWMMTQRKQLDAKHDRTRKERANEIDSEFI